jgi:hypothetical protein
VSNDVDRRDDRVSYNCLCTEDRIAGATRDINGLKEAFNRGESPITSSTDIHAVCDLVKSWFRVLPEPVFPPDSYYAVMDAMRTCCSLYEVFLAC